MYKKKYLLLLVLCIFLLLSIGFLFYFYIIQENRSNSSKLNSDSKVITLHTSNSAIDTNATITKELDEKIKKFGINTKGIPVLMYHFFYDKKTGQKGKDNNYIEISNFKEQLLYLKQNDYYFSTFQELQNYIDGKLDLPAKSIIITVDDGDPSFFKLAAPIIQEYNIPVTSFVITSWYGEDILSPYYSSSIQFESHSHAMHTAGKNGKGLLMNSDYSPVLQDLQTSISIVKSHEAFCYPFGEYNSTIQKVLKNLNFKVAFTTKYGKVKIGMQHYELPRIRITQQDTLKSFIQKIQ